MVASLGFEPLLVFGVYSSWAFAYLDPGTGSLILQALFGAIAALAVGITTFWSRIKIFLGRFRRRPGHGGE